MSQSDCGTHSHVVVCMRCMLRLISPLTAKRKKNSWELMTACAILFFEICEPWGREECRVGRRVYVLVYIGFIMWTCTPIYHVYVWRICLWYICVGRARCVGGSPCSYKNAFSLLIAVYSLGWKRTMWAPSKPKKVSEKLYSARCLTMFNSNCLKKLKQTNVKPHRCAGTCGTCLTCCFSLFCRVKSSFIIW